MEQLYRHFRIRADAQLYNGKFEVKLSFKKVNKDRTNKYRLYNCLHIKLARWTLTLKTVTEIVTKDQYFDLKFLIEICGHNSQINHFESDPK